MLDSGKVRYSTREQYCCGRGQQAGSVEEKHLSVVSLAIAPSQLAIAPSQLKLHTDRDVSVVLATQLVKTAPNMLTHTYDHFKQVEHFHTVEYWRKRHIASMIVSTRSSRSCCYTGSSATRATSVHGEHLSAASPCSF